MTKDFSTLVTALAISASLMAVTAPVSAFTATSDVSRIANGDLGSGRFSSGDVSSGRINRASGLEQGSRR